MHTGFTDSFYTQNRRRLRERCSSEVPIVITAHGLLQLTADSTYPFQQDSNFWYLTGLNEPDLLLVMDGDIEYIMVPGRSGSREAFDGAVDFTELRRISGISQIMNEEDGWKKLGRRLKKVGKVQTLAAPPPYIEQYGMYTNPARGRLIERLNNWRADIEVIDVRNVLVSLRSRKQTAEITAIKKAIDITLHGIQTVTTPAALQAYHYEFEIENDLTTAFRTLESRGHAFTPIVASGKRAVTLHNVQNDGELHSGDLLVLDVGAEVSHYAADITRTVALGVPSARQQEVFMAVLDVQKYALTLLKPGTIIREYEAAVEEYMGKKLIELGLINDATHESIRTFYPHATSHFLGLDVHDVGEYAEPLEAGMVLTCEPGVYIPDEGIGIRIEDDVLITESGHEVLSDKLPALLTANA